MVNVNPIEDSSQSSVIDLFSGCGGISCGLERAGCKIVAGIDIEEAYLKTFRFNFPDANALLCDLSCIPASALMEKIGLTQGQLSVLTGGPPCQGFSKNVPRRNRYMEDPRNQLVHAFLRFAEAARPRFILMENVAEMKAGFEGAYTNLLVETLEAKHLGYTVKYCVLNATDYGVPQRRRRAFFLASRDNENVRFPEPTHDGRTEATSLFASKEHISVWEAISDLPALEHGEGEDPCDYEAEPRNDFQQWARQGSRQVHNHIARRLQALQYERLASLQPGEGIKELANNLRPKSGYSGAYGRLTKTMIAPTITRWVFHPGSAALGIPFNRA